MATGEEIIDRILRRLDELSTTSPVHWTRAEILDLVNEALKELNLIAWEFQDTATDTATTSENVYDTPADMLAIIDIRHGNKYLLRESLGDLDKEYDWEDDDANRMTVQTWSPLGLNKYVIAPRPLASTTLYLEGLTEHTDVEDSADSDLPNRIEYDDSIEDYVIERAMFKEGGAELQQMAPQYKSFFEKAQGLSGRNINRMHPHFSRGAVADNTLREKNREKGKD